MSLRKIKLRALKTACEEYRQAYDHCTKLHLDVSERADMPTRSSMQRAALARYIKAQEQHQLALEDYEATGVRAGLTYLANRTLGGSFVPPGRGVHPLMGVATLVLMGAILYGGVMFFMSIGVHH